MQAPMAEKLHAPQAETGRRFFVDKATARGYDNRRVTARRARFAMAQQIIAQTHEALGAVVKLEAADDFKFG